MQVLIAYDITNDKRRRKVEKLLSSYGIRVNYSVFELTITKTQYKTILKELLKQSSKKEDNIRIYHFNQATIKNSFVLHSNKKVFEYEELYF